MDHGRGRYVPSSRLHGHLERPTSGAGLEIRVPVAEEVGGDRFYLIAESDLNDARILASEKMGGLNLHAQWSDDFHHCLHVLLTGEQAGYYKDFGGLRQFAKVFREGYAYTGEYSCYRKRRHGNSPRLAGVRQFVVYSQNHDQIGNRFHGERLSQLTGFEELKLAAGAVLLSPFIPLLFMGEEYGEEAPFQYFISHGDPGLVQAVRQGRRAEFAAFSWQTEPPDPQDENTFLRAKLNHELRREGRFRTLWEFYRELIRLRGSLVPLARLSKEHCEVTGFDHERILVLRRWSEGEQAVTLFNFNHSQVSIPPSIPGGHWHKAIDSTDPRWQGIGSTLPSELDVNERIMLTLPPTSLALFVSGVFEAKTLGRN